MIHKQSKGPIAKRKGSPHDSAVTHVAGKSTFIDDRIPVRNELHVGLVYAEVAAGILNAIETETALMIEGVVGIYTHADLAHNIWGPIIHDQPMLVEVGGEIQYYGEVIAVIAAETKEAIKEAKAAIVLDITPTKAILSIDDAKEAERFIGVTRVIERGDLEGAFERSKHTLSGVFRCNGQNHFYLESQAAVVYPTEQGQLEVHSSSQHPTETQHLVAEALGLKFHQVICIVKRMGGAFGGKEAQAAPFAVYAALVAAQTGRPARCVITKDDDMIMTGNRHPFQNDWKVGFNDEGVIQAIDFDLYSDGGAYADLSTSIMERAMLLADNAYYLPNAKVRGTVCRTNIHPNTAFRGFGGPQGIATIESVIEDIAQHLGIDSFLVRQRNCYGVEERNTTHYEQKLDNNTLPELFEKLYESSEYQRRRDEIDAYNQSSLIDIRGLSMVAVKFGISFTSRFLNQGNALVNLHTDGTVQVSTGGTEMGQGLNVKIRHVVATCFGISDEDVMVLATSTDKNHNTSPTAASSGSDINCAAAEIACNQIIERIKNVAAQVFERHGEPLDASEEYEVIEGLNIEHIRLVDSQVYSALHPDQSMDLSELLGICYFNRISLSGYGFFKTPGIFFDKEKGRGTPFLYFTNGTAVSEVSVNRFTGEVKVLRTDILMDLGRPINEAIDYGQVAGGFIQGMGWATTENLYYGENGMLISHSPTTYKIPSIQDMPREFNMELLANDGNVVNVRRSKAVGEPPLVLGISAWSAAKDALSYVNKENSDFALPATNEEVLKFIDLDAE